MTLYAHIDNEVPWGGAHGPFGEWDQRHQHGASTVERTAAAGFPERGGFGLRCRTVGHEAAYMVAQDVLPALGPGETVFLGLWLRVLSAASAYMPVARLGAAGRMLELETYADRLIAGVRKDDGTTAYTNVHYVRDDRWRWVVLELRRATGPGAADGLGRLWLEGWAKEASGLDNYHLCASSDRDLLLGAGPGARDGLDLCLDEVRIASDLPQPLPPQVGTSATDPGRIVVLTGPGEPGRSFAAACVAQLGVPRGNHVVLHNASSAEWLPHYPAFAADVEEPLNDCFARRAELEQRCAAFLVGPGVPGGFLDAGEPVSADARLMRLGTPFSGPLANPFYAPQQVERLSADALRSVGLRLAVRMDVGALATGLLDRASAASGATLLHDAKLLCDDPDYRASLPAGRLRINVAAPVQPAESEAFLFRSDPNPSYGESLLRLACINGADDACATIRDGGSPCGAALHDAGYAACLGSAGSGTAFDARSFFEMLRIGGTFAEAALVASPTLDGPVVAAGSPLLRATFPLGGRNVYAGDAPGAVDYDEPVAFGRPGQTVVRVPVALDAEERRAFSVRNVDETGREESGTAAVAVARTDAAGTLLDAPLPTIGDPSVRRLGAGRAEVACTFSVEPGQDIPDRLLVCIEGPEEADWNSPDAEALAPQSPPRELIAAMENVAVSARVALRLALGERLGPIAHIAVPDAPAPAPVRLLEVTP